MTSDGCLVAEFVIVVANFSGGIVGIPGLQTAAGVGPIDSHGNVDSES